MIWFVASVEFWNWQAGQKWEDRTFFSQWIKFTKRLTSRKTKRKAMLNGFLYFLIIKKDYMKKGIRKSTFKKKTPSRQ